MNRQRGLLHRWGPGWRRSVAGVAGLSLLGCTATIDRRDRPALQARILRSNAEEVWVKGDGQTNDVIPCREITNIRHPGGMGLYFGSFLGLASAVSIASEKERTCTECGPNITSGSVLFLLTVPLLAIGGMAWLISHGAASRCRYGE